MVRLVALYDSVTRSAARDRLLRARTARVRRLARVHAGDDARPPARRRRGGHRRGRDLHGDRPPAAGRPSARRVVHARLVLAAPRPADAVRRAAADEGVARLPPLGVRERRARPRAPPGRPLARRGRRARAAPGHLRHLEAPRRSAVGRPGPRAGSTCTRRSASSSTRPATGRTSSSPSWPRPERSTRSISRASTRARSSTSRRTRCSTGASSRRSRTPGSRIRRSPTRRGRSSSRTRLASPGTRRSTRSRTSRARPVAAADDQHQAVALRSRQAALRRLRLLRRARRSSPYGGGQWELGPGRGQIQYLASLFHPDTPNDVAPGGYNAPEPQPGLPESPLEPAISPTGFRWAG